VKSFRLRDFAIGAMTLVLSLITSPFVSDPARAEIVDVIVSGTVMRGVDSTGVFGSKGANLAGSTFIAVFSYDPSLGYSFGNVVTGGDWSGVGIKVTVKKGGMGDIAVSPSISTLVTIGGSSVDFGGGAGNFSAEDTHSYYLTARGSLGISIVYAAADMSYGNLYVGTGPAAFELDVSELSVSPADWQRISLNSLRTKMD
jgi:hypothetical protein